jgi:hypothetical protein
MTDQSRQVQRVYLLLMLLHTLAASFIWGINTLFLLDAGLSNAQAFSANAFFTAGQVLFEVPTVSRRTFVAGASHISLAR